MGCSLPTALCACFSIREGNRDTPYLTTWIPFPNEPRSRHRGQLPVLFPTPQIARTHLSPAQRSWQ